MYDTDDRRKDIPDEQPGSYPIRELFIRVKTVDDLLEWLDRAGHVCWSVNPIILTYFHPTKARDKPEVDHLVTVYCIW